MFQTANILQQCRWKGTPWRMTRPWSRCGGCPGRPPPWTSASSSVTATLLAVIILFSHWSILLLLASHWSDVQGPNGIHFCTNDRGQPSGEAFIEMERPEDVEKALEKHKQNMGRRWGFILHALSLKTSFSRKQRILQYWDHSVSDSFLHTGHILVLIFLQICRGVWVPTQRHGEGEERRKWPREEPQWKIWSG